MKLLNRTLRIVLSASLALAAPVANAEDPRDVAHRVVKESQELAKQDAKAYVKQDFYKLIDVLTEEMSQYATSQELYQVYARYMTELENEFSALAIENVKELTPTWEALEKYMERYEKSVRKQFVASWIPSEQKRQYENARAMINAFAGDFQDMCAVGRSNAEKTYTVPGIPVPDYVSSLNGRLSPNYLGALTGGLPISWNYSYHSATAGSEAANKDRAHVVNAFVTASNLANSAWITSKISALTATTASGAAASGAAASGAASSGGMMASVNSAMVAAAPYLLAAAAIAIVAVHLIAQKEAAELAQKIVDANNIMARGTADHKDVQKYYRQSCEEYSNMVNQFVLVFNDLDQEEQRQKRIKEAQELQPALDKWEEESPKQGFYLCQNHLQKLYQEEGCTQIAEGQSVGQILKTHKVDETKPKTMCLIDAKKENIAAANGNCVIPFDEKQREKVIETAISEMDKYNKQYPFSEIVKLVSAKLALVFKDQKQLQESIRKISEKDVRDSQQRAFDNLVRYINVVQRLKKDVESVKSLNAEAKVYSQYFEFRDKVLVAGKNFIKVVFDKHNKQALLTELNDIKKSFKSFSRRYRHLKEVQALGRSLNYVIAQAEEL